jgi:hypothetical protein
MITLHAELAHIIKEGTPDVNNRLVEEFVDHFDVTSTSRRSDVPYFNLVLVVARRHGGNSRESAPWSAPTCGSFGITGDRW